MNTTKLVGAHLSRPATSNPGTYPNLAGGVCAGKESSSDTIPSTSWEWFCMQELPMACFAHKTAISDNDCPL